MKILVNEIPPKGLSTEGDLDPKELDINTSSINFLSPIHVNCLLTRSKDDVFAKCKVTSIIKETCSRCLSDFDMKIERDIDLYYELQGELSIELDDKLKDEIVVDYPIKILCKEDCKGLCSLCGEDLNKTSCSCNCAKTKKDK